MDWSTKLLPIIAGCMFTIGFILLLNPLARHFGWVDKPDNIRKRHGSVIPLTGGMAMLLGCVATLSWIDGCFGSCVHSRVLGAMSIMALVGLWDDRFNLSPRFRILLQTGVGYLLALVAGLSMDNFGNIFGFGDVVLPHFLGIIFTVFCVVGAMNAMNMIDGVDGLAGGVTLVALLWMLLLTNLQVMPETNMLLALAGCVFAYLIFNLRHPWRKKAAIFMGDAGSMMIGTALVWLIISLSQKTLPGTDITVLPPVIGLWLVAIPLLDTLSVMFKRRRNGQSPFKADRSHLHHILQDAGLSDRATTWFVLLLATVLGGVAIGGWKLGLPEPVLFFAFLLMAAAYYYFIHHTDKLAGFICSLRRKPLICETKG